MNPLQKEINGLSEFFSDGDTILVGCSGGSDSQSLVGVLLDSPLKLNVIIGHVNHRLRPESYEDALKVATFAKKVGIQSTIYTLYLDKSDENTAREKRHQALEYMASAINATHIALAHNANDQLETVLMRVCRGAGLVGLGGIRKTNGKIVRPLLNTPRTKIDEYMRYKGWYAVEDSSNHTDMYFRNRVRRQVVPFFLNENPNVLNTASCMAETLQEEQITLAHYEQMEWERVYSKNELDLSIMSTLTKGMSARLLIRFWKANSPTNKQLSKRHIHNALNVIYSQEGGKTIQLPGVSFLKKNNKLSIKR